MRKKMVWIGGKNGEEREREGGRRKEVEKNIDGHIHCIVCHGCCLCLTITLHYNWHMNMLNLRKVIFRVFRGPFGNRKALESGPPQ